MDVTKKFVEVVDIGDPDGNHLTQPIVFEWRPSYCNLCDSVGHNAKFGPNKSPKSNVSEEEIYPTSTGTTKGV